MTEGSVKLTRNLHLVPQFNDSYLLMCVLVSDVEEVGESVECVLCKTVIEKLDQLLEGKTAVVSQSNLIKSTQTFPIPNV